MKVTDDTRLKSIVPTTKFLLEQGANVILCSHFGRPKGEIIETGKNGRLTPVVKPLEALLETGVTKVDDCIGPQVEAYANALKSGQVLLLENTRFHKGETKNDPELSAGLGKLADYFVMDAFGTAHRAHSSTEGVTKHMKLCAAGYLMEKELKYLIGAVEHPKRPMMAIVGGAKGAYFSFRFGYYFPDYSLDHANIRIPIPCTTMHNTKKNYMTHTHTYTTIKYDSQHQNSRH